ncbi:hypothetical protein [Actinoplanes sp. NPDC020271]|uniref:hypothetical protein n=1 Tax=Actinoplanes sp. NPDC020271 TaxID=3363896 RepID=UPI0037A63E25
MHDQMLGLLDDCLGKLTALRAELAAGRCVRLGERRGLVLEAIDIADEFAASAGDAIGETTRRELTPVTTLPVGGEPVRGVTPVILSEAAC